MHHRPHLIGICCARISVKKAKAGYCAIVIYLHYCLNVISSTISIDWFLWFFLIYTNLFSHFCLFFSFRTFIWNDQHHEMIWSDFFHLWKTSPASLVWKCFSFEWKFKLNQFHIEHKRKQEENQYTNNMVFDQHQRRHFNLHFNQIEFECGLFSIWSYIILDVRDKIKVSWINWFSVWIKLWFSIFKMIVLVCLVDSVQRSVVLNETKRTFHFLFSIINKEKRDNYITKGFHASILVCNLFFSS